MAFLYDLFSYIGYFFIMIAFMVCAIITAKYKFSWAIYAAGAAIQLVALIGNQTNASLYGNSMVLYWIIYFALLIVSAVTIVDQQQKEIRNQREQHIAENKRQLDEAEKRCDDDCQQIEQKIDALQGDLRKAELKKQELRTWQH